jgi:2-dehydropantoate 2-reductase
MGDEQFNILGAGALGLGLYTQIKSKNKYLITRTKGPTNITTQLKNDKSSIVKLQYHPNKTIKNNLIICTKAYDTRAALLSISKKIDKTCIIALCQNGHQNITNLQKILPNNIFALTPCLFGATLKQNKLTLSNTPEIKMGPTNNKHCDKIFSLSKILNANGILTTYDNNIQNDIKKKLIINASLNALGGLHQKTHQQIMQTPELKQQAQVLCIESTNILNQQQFICEPNTMWNNIINLMPKIGSNYSSMAQDIFQQKQTEIDYINGYIIQLANEQKNQAIQNSKIYNQVKEYYANKH